MMQYISTKFNENTFSSFQVIEWTRLRDGGQTDNRGKNKSCQKTTQLAGKG